jgi:hypothetical protein
MVKIESLSDAKKFLTAPRNGVAEFFSVPNFDFTGKKVVVLGNSTALNHVDTSLLRRVTTFGVNRICRVLTPDVLLFTDPPILKSEEEYYRKFTGPVLTWQSYERSWMHDNPNLRFFNLTPVTEIAAWRWPKLKTDPLIRQGTTPSYCLQMAVLGGAKSVAILGIDFSAPSIAASGKTHFYGNGFQQGSTGGGDWSRPENAAFFSKFPEWALEFGVKAYNLSPFKDTPIHNAKWPKVTLEEYVKDDFDS